MQLYRRAADRHRLFCMYFLAQMSCYYATSTLTCWEVLWQSLCLSFFFQICRCARPYDTLCLWNFYRIAPAFRCEQTISFHNTYLCFEIKSRQAGEKCGPQSGLFSLLKPDCSTRFCSGEPQRSRPRWPTPTWTCALSESSVSDLSPFSNHLQCFTSPSFSSSDHRISTKWTSKMSSWPHRNICLTP